MTKKQVIDITGLTGRNCESFRDAMMLLKDAKRASCYRTTDNDFFARKHNKSLRMYNNFKNYYQLRKAGKGHPGLFLFWDN